MQSSHSVRRWKSSAGSHIWDVPGPEAYHGKDVFLTEALTREAIKCVDQAVADGRPFFLYLAHYAVHVPYAPDNRFVQRYRDAGLDETESIYAALIEGMDKSLGDVLDALGRHRISDRFQRPEQISGWRSAVPCARRV